MQDIHAVISFVYPATSHRKHCKPRSQHSSSRL